LGCGTLILIAIIVAMFSGNAGTGFNNGETISRLLSVKSATFSSS